MASKYEKLFPTLKPLPVQDVKYQALVDGVKSQILEGGHQSTDDDLVDEAITETLENIEDEVTALCTMLIEAGKGRRQGHVFGRYWLQLRRIESGIDDRLKAARLLLEAYQQLGSNQLQAEGMKSLNLEGLGRVLLQPEVQVKVMNPDALRQWCIEAGLSRSLNIHHGTIQSLTKERLIGGLSAPEGVEAFVHTKLTK